MKGYVWSLKLAAGIALLVASVALAGPHTDQQADTPDEAKTDAPPTVEFELDGTTLPLKVPAVEKGISWYSLPSSGHDYGTTLLSDVIPTRVKLPKYWIGVKCRAPLPEFLHEHLDLPKKQGLLVVEVVPEGPAAKAGLRPHDILLSGNAKPLRNVLDLIQVVEETQDKVIAFELIHKGTPRTVEIKPGKHPWRRHEEEPAADSPPYRELDRVLRWFEQNYPRWGNRRMRLRIIHPGTILPPDAPVHPALPGGMSIMILKKGDEPTKITVKRDDKVWKVTEKELDKLPKDVRPHVERMLHGIVAAPEMLAPRFDVVPEWVAPKKPPRLPKEKPSARSRLEERMDRMNERLERLQKMLEKLHDKTGSEKEK